MVAKDAAATLWAEAKGAAEDFAHSRLYVAAAVGAASMLLVVILRPAFAMKARASPYEPERLGKRAVVVPLVAFAVVATLGFARQQWGAYQRQERRRSAPGPTFA